MGPDLLGLGGELIGRALGLVLAVWLAELDAGVGVDDRGVFHVVPELAACAHVRLHLQFDARAVGPIPGRRLVDGDLGLVRVGVDDEFEVFRLATLRPAGDLRRLAAGEL